MVCIAKCTPEINILGIISEISLCVRVQMQPAVIILNPLALKGWQLNGLNSIIRIDKAMIAGALKLMQVLRQNIVIADSVLIFEFLRLLRSESNG